MRVSFHLMCGYTLKGREKENKQTTVIIKKKEADEASVGRVLFVSVTAVDDQRFSSLYF